MKKYQSFINFTFHDDSTQTGSNVTQTFDQEDVTWLDLLEQFNRLIRGAGFIAPKLDEFIAGVEFSNDFSSEEKQAA